MKSLTSLVLAATLLGSVEVVSAQIMVTSATGDVRYAAPNSLYFQPLQRGARLPVGAKIRTGTSGAVVLVPIPGAAVKLSEKSEITVTQAVVGDDAQKKPLRKSDIYLSSGTLSALIDPSRVQPADFKITTPQGIAAARGTFFAVSLEKDRMSVAVKKGKVGIASNKVPDDQIQEANQPATSQPAQPQQAALPPSIPVASTR